MTIPPDKGDGTAVPPHEGDGMTMPPDEGDGTAMLPDEGDGTSKNFLLSEWAHIKLTNNGRTTTGGHCEWLPHVDKLILEMLANRTPPTCIQANIFDMTRVLHSEIDL